jgi:hypothetical protein
MAEELTHIDSVQPLLARSVLVDRLSNDLKRTFPDGPPPGVDINAIARDAISSMDGARVRTYVPLLAFRAAREMLVKIRE